jgi:hypothetical protein
MEKSYIAGGRRKRVVIVGAGMAGSILASGLSKSHDTVVIDLSKKRMPLPIDVREEGTPAGFAPHVGSGPGGTTAYWHNGLIVPDEGDFATWPISKMELSKYFARAFFLLSGTELEQVAEAADRVQAEYMERGVPPELLGNFLYYPKRRRNLWKVLDVDKRPVAYLQGRARRLVLSEDAQVRGVLIETERGQETIQADVVICCAGGLSSPLIIRETGRFYQLNSLMNAGSHYHDHPWCFIADLKLSSRLHDIWNYSPPGMAGVLRTPMVVRSPAGQKVAFYLRPAALFHQKQNAFSVISDLRNSPYNVMHIARLFRNPSEMLEIASFLIGVNFPTDNYSVLLNAEQMPSDDLAVEACHATGAIIRRWQLDDEFKRGLHTAFQFFLKSIGPMIEDVRVYPNWEEGLKTGAHHSGTCRIAAQPNRGICNSGCKVFGINNAYICDGSVIPSTGYASSGLTITALSLRLLEFLEKDASVQREAISGSV